MKNLNTKYKYGHLWDITTGKRIILKDNSEILIAGDNLCFESEDVNNKPNKILSQEEQIQKVKSIDDLAKYQKILDRGTILLVDIKVTIKKTKKERIECVFKVELQEDLYIYSKTKWKNPAPNLFDCACKVVNEKTKSLEFFEIINAGSLNSAYEKTFTHYFANHGSPTCNAFDRFYFYNKRSAVFLRSFRQFKS